MAKRNIALICILLAAVNVAWLYRFSRNAASIRRHEARNREEQYRLNRENQHLRLTLASSVSVDYCTLPSGLIIKDMDGNPGKLGNLLEEADKLILYLSGNHCSSCVDAALFLLKNKAEQIGPGNILILYDRAGSPEGIWKKRRLIAGGIRFIEIQPDVGNHPLQDSEYPCFFLAGPSMIMGRTLVFMPSLETTVEEYLENIAERF